MPPSPSPPLRQSNHNNHHVHGSTPTRPPRETSNKRPPKTQKPRTPTQNKNQIFYPPAPILDVLGGCPSTNVPAALRGLPPARRQTARKRRHQKRLFEENFRCENPINHTSRARPKAATLCRIGVPFLHRTCVGTAFRLRTLSLSCAAPSAPPPGRQPHRHSRADTRTSSGLPAADYTQCPKAHGAALRLSGGFRRRCAAAESRGGCQHYRYVPAPRGCLFRRSGALGATPARGHHTRAWRL